MLNFIRALASVPASPRRFPTGAGLTVGALISLGLWAAIAVAVTRVHTG